MQLALQAADLFSETEGFGVSRGQIARDGLNLTLKETQLDRKVNILEKLQRNLLTSAPHVAFGDV